MSNERVEYPDLWLELKNGGEHVGLMFVDSIELDDAGNMTINSRKNPFHKTFAFDRILAVIPGEQAWIAWINEAGAMGHGQAITCAVKVDAWFPNKRSAPA